MRGNQGGLADREGVVEGFVGNVRDIDHHSLPVHLANNFFAIVGETVVSGLVGGGIGPFVVVEVGEGHVANAEIAVDTDHADVVAQHVAAFDAHQDSNLSLFMRASNVIGSAGEGEIFRVFPHVLLDGIDLVESFLNRERAHGAAVNPDGKENGVHAAFAHAGDVDVARGIALAEVEIAGEEALSGVVVSVNDDGGEVESAGLIRETESAGAETSRATAPKRQTNRVTSERIISPPEKIIALVSVRSQIVYGVERQS